MCFRCTSIWGVVVDCTGLMSLPADNFIWIIRSLYMGCHYIDLKSHLTMPAIEPAMYIAIPQARNMNSDIFTISNFQAWPVCEVF